MLIDSVNIRLQLDTDHRERLFKLLNTAKWKNDKNTVVGKLNNLYVKIGSTFIFLSGSIPKYYKGNNYENLTARELYKAFRKLGSELDVPLLDGTIYKVELGYNFISNRNPKEYLSCINKGTMPNHDIGFFNNTVYYSNTLRKIVCYDKSTESNLAHYTSILRYEIKIKKSLKSQFDCKNEVLIRDILKPRFLKRLIKYWHKYYSLIPKTEYLLGEPPKTTTEMLKYLAKKYLLHGNNAQLEKELIQYNRERDYYDYRNQPLRLINSLNDLLEKGSKTDCISPLFELNQMVEEAKELMLQDVQSFRNSIRKAVNNDELISF